LPHAEPAAAATCAPGQSSSCTSRLAKATDLRDCITGLTSTCAPTRRLAAGTTVEMQCSAYGDRFGAGSTSDVWFRIRVPQWPFADIRGWVPASAVTSPRQVGRCAGELPSLGQDDYEGSQATCATETRTVRGVSYCRDGTFRGVNSAVASPRRYLWRNCTDFAAVRMRMPGGWGDAKAWDEAARRDLRRWAIDSTPHVGDVAQSDAGAHGHVAVVLEVAGSKVRLEEYNAKSVRVDGQYYGDGRYSRTRWVARDGLEFIRQIG
jgi:surface antigen